MFYFSSAGTVDCNYESEHNCDEYGYNYRILGTKEIAGIVAGCFAVVILVVIIVVICCYRKQRGISQKWKEEKLGHVNTAASVHSLNGKVPHSSNNSTKPWTSESSKHGFASIRRSPNLPRAKIARSQRTMGSDNSMFDSKSLVLECSFCDLNISLDFTLFVETPFRSHALFIKNQA